MNNRSYKYLLVFQFIFVAWVPLEISAQGFGQVPGSNAKGVQALDDRILIDLSNHRTPVQTDIFMFLSKYNNLVNIAVPAGVFSAGVINNNKGTRQDALYIASSSAVNLVVNTLIKKIVRRRRPFNGPAKINAVYHPGSYSFPSGHSSSSFATATSLSQVYRRWYVIAPAYLWAGSVSYSRMYLGVHYPSDVASGIVLGTGTALSMKFIQPGH